MKVVPDNTRNMPDPLEVLAGLRLEDGATWGAAAHPFQLDDARAFIDGVPRRHFWLRPRGASKSSDAGAILLSLLVTQAPPRSRSYLVAVDSEQAGLIADALGGFLVRTGGIPARLEAKRVVAVNTGATIEVVASDAASAFGLRPWILVADEVCQWPASDNHRRLMSALLSALPKVRDSRALLLSTPGDPAHFSYRLWERAVADPKTWRSSLTSGPTPWWTPEDVAAARADLLPSEFERLVMARWASPEERLTSLDDVRACVAHDGPLPAVPGTRYVLGLDVGVKRDSTALVVGHRERDDVVIDRVITWTGSSREPVDLREVQAAVVELSREYNRAELVFDPSQAILLAQGAAGANVGTSEFVFSVSNVNRLARNLYVAIRDRHLRIPNDDGLISELSEVRLVERGPGQYRLDHKASGHDDQAIAVGMVVDFFTDNRLSSARQKIARYLEVAHEFGAANSGLVKESNWVPPPDDGLPNVSPWGVQ